MMQYHLSCCILTLTLIRVCSDDDKLACVLCFVDFRETPRQRGGGYSPAAEGRHGEVQGERVKSHRTVWC